MKGLEYICYLLEMPNTEIPAVDLIVKPLPTNKNTKDYDNDLSILSGLNEAEPIVDKKTIKEVKQRLDDLHDQKEERFKLQGDTTEIDLEINQLEEYMKSAIGIYGKSRKFSSPEEDARTSITKNIKRAIAKIRTNGMTELADYLDRTIRTGGKCSYVPQVSITWKTSAN